MFLHFVILELRGLPLFSRSNVENIDKALWAVITSVLLHFSLSLSSFKPSPEVNLLQSDWQRPHQYLTVFSLLPWSTICLFQANCSVMQWRGIVLILTQPWSDYVERKITFIFLFFIRFQSESWISPSIIWEGLFLLLMNGFLCWL